MRLARRHVGQTEIAASLTFVLAVVLVLPLIALGIQAAHEVRLIVDLLRDIRQNGFGTPDWLSNLPYVGDAAATWWQANIPDPEAARALFAEVQRSGVVALTRTFGIEVASRSTILAFTLLTLFFVYRDGPSAVREAQPIGIRLFGSSVGHLAQNVVATVRGTVCLLACGTDCELGGQLSNPSVQLPRLGEVAALNTLLQGSYGEKRCMPAIATNSEMSCCNRARCSKTPT